MVGKLSLSPPHHLGGEDLLEGIVFSTIYYVSLVISVV